MSNPPRSIRQEAEKATEAIDELAPGLLRSQLPVELPGLGHVNCYILEDERGIAVIDPGLPGSRSFAKLEGRLKLAGYKVGDIHTAVITHSHFDHFGGPSASEPKQVPTSSRTRASAPSGKPRKPKKTLIWTE